VRDPNPDPGPGLDPGPDPGPDPGLDEQRMPARLSPDALALLCRDRSGATEAAFFDLDRTVIARSATLLMGRPLRRSGLLDRRTMLRGVFRQLRYQLVGFDHDRIDQMRRSALGLTRGWEAAQVRALARETVDRLGPALVYAEALALIAQHRAAGRDVWIISTSGEEVVGPFCRLVGVDRWVATRAGIDLDGRYDGTLDFFAYAEAKATAMRQLAEEHGYDLDRCYAYSDSGTDLPMLRVVGHPVAVNPDQQLRRAATAAGWQVRHFRLPVVGGTPARQAARVSMTIAAVMMTAAMLRRGRR
jgi:HAD superfamily hydrolase (TIGR01490 family)